MRRLTWHFGNGDQPAYYMDCDANPIHCRIYSRKAPVGSGLKVDIRQFAPDSDWDSGTSIFANVAVDSVETYEYPSEIQYSSQSAAFTDGEGIDGGTSSASAELLAVIMALINMAFFNFLENIILSRQ